MSIIVKILTLDVGSSVKLKAFGKFSDTSEALVAATSMLESTLSKPLKKFLKKNIVDKEMR